MKKISSQGKIIIGFGVLIVILIIVIFILIGNLSKKIDQKENKTTTTTTAEIKISDNEDVIKDQVLGVFSFTNTSLIYKNHTSTLSTDVKNTSDTAEKLDEFKIHVFDKSGNEMIELTGFIGDTLAAGETKTITSSYGEDLTDAAKITYEVVK